MDKSKLDEWVGRRVGVQLAEDETHKFSCTLEDAEARGIVVSYVRKEDGQTHHRFFPWANVRYVHLSNKLQSDG